MCLGAGRKVIKRKRKRERERERERKKEGERDRERKEAKEKERKQNGQKRTSAEFVCPRAAPNTHER